MSGSEAWGWIWFMWLFSIASTVWIVMSIYDPTLWASPGILFGIVLAVTFVSWLFRITYLAGVSRR